MEFCHVLYEEYFLKLKIIIIVSLQLCFEIEQEILFGKNWRNEFEN